MSVQKLCAYARIAGLLVAFALMLPTSAAATPSVAPRAHSHGPDPAVGQLRAHASARAAAAAPGSEWCGTKRESDDTHNELANGDYRYHAIYLMTADARDRFRTNATQIQADAFGASALLEHLYGRAIRYDMGTSCGPDYLDISAVRTSLTNADFAQAARTNTGTLGLVKRALASAGFPILHDGDDRGVAAPLVRNYVVWLEAPAPHSACGVAEDFADATRDQGNWNNYGGKVAVVFRADGGFCGEAAVRHEIGHTLGALQPQAPHAFDGAHCDDAYEDTMCYPDAPVRGRGEFNNQYFDYKNDDYWDPPQGPALPWWTVNLNRFLCDTPTCNVSSQADTRQAMPAVRRAAARRAVTRRRSARQASPRVRSRRASVTRGGEPVRLAAWI